MRCYQKLKTVFQNHFADHVLQHTDMTPALIAKAGGAELYKQVKKRVEPMLDCPVTEIADASRILIEQHLASYQGGRILMQRQVLRIVPVSECTYTWRKHNGRFWVYGTDHQVEIRDYPYTCCCCRCVIL